jgi:hypothetical protein
MGTGAPSVLKLQLLIDMINFQKSSRDGRRLDLQESLAYACKDILGKMGGNFIAWGNHGQGDGLLRFSLVHILLLGLQDLLGLLDHLWPTRLLFNLGFFEFLGAIFIFEPSKLLRDPLGTP